MSVQDTNVIDFVAVDPNGDVLLVMVEGRHWDGSDEQIWELQEKINTYTAFAMGGHLFNKHPELHGRSMRIELRCAELPDSKTSSFLEMVSDRLKDEGLGFSVKKIGSPGS